MEWATGVQLQGWRFFLLQAPRTASFPCIPLTLPAPFRSLNGPSSSREVSVLLECGLAGSWRRELDR